VGDGDGGGWRNQTQWSGFEYHFKADKRVRFSEKNFWHDICSAFFGTIFVLKFLAQFLKAEKIFYSISIETAAKIFFIFFL